MDVERIGAIVDNLMTNRFNGANLENVRSINFYTDEVTQMDKMFKGAKAKELNLGSFRTQKVVTMEAMFEGCTVEVLDISNFTMIGATEVLRKDMFLGAGRLKEVYTLSEVDADAVVNGTGIRSGVDIYVGSRGWVDTYLYRVTL